jgi:hypothetical protein
MIEFCLYIVVLLFYVIVVLFQFIVDFSSMSFFYQIQVVLILQVQ